MLDTVHATFEGEPAAAEAWRVRTVRLGESLDAPYELEARLVTDADAPDPRQLLGKPATVTLLRAGAPRRVHGIVAELTERTIDDDDLTAVVDVTVRPALEALRHRVDTRIFQEKSVPEILAEVLEAGLGPYGRAFEDRTQASYPACEYVVQYDESDLAFCERLMQREGISYWFEHEGDVEQLVLADAPQAFGEITTAAGGSPIPITERGQGDLDDESIHHLGAWSRVTPTKVALRHFDWTAPSTPIEAEASDAPEGDAAVGASIDPEREVYVHDTDPPTLSDYAGTAYGANDAAARATVRREQHASGARLAGGRSTLLAMRPGATVEVSGHPIVGRDGAYRVTSVEHRLDAESDAYENRFEARPEAVPVRPARTRPAPRIHSVQTAIVVGPAGEEIHTDAHGRIKVQFHWDRLGASEERSSCWIRVLQPWAGPGWGFLFLPRIGMEVVVKFVDGDPDRPLVIGSVYDGDRRPPYPLPDDKTKSTIKTESSLGGGGYNELRFDDAAGAEQIWIHAQKDFDEVVENDHTTTVHHQQHIRVDNDQRQEIGNDQTEHVFANQDLTVDADRTVTVHGDYAETIDGSETRTVRGGVTETIEAGEDRTVTGSMTETIVGDRTQDITGDSSETISATLSQTIAGAVSLSTPATYDITATGGVTIVAPAGVTIVAPAGHTIVAPGGQTIIDGEWAKSGADWHDSIALKLSVTILKIKWRAIAITAYGASFEWSTFKLDKAAVKMFGFGNYLEKAAVKRKARAIHAEVAGAHVDGPGA